MVSRTLHNNIIIISYTIIADSVIVSFLIIPTLYIYNILTTLLYITLYYYVVPTLEIL